MHNLVIDEIRGEVVEARHVVNAIVMKKGQAEMIIGNPHMVVPMRSTAKPLMLCPLLKECKREGILLSDEKIAIMASSHNGEDVHRDAVMSILDMSNSTVDNLVCGCHLPYFEWLYDEFFAEQNLKKRQLFHNCSAKHAGMILLAKLLGVSREQYWEIKHPVQQAILKSIECFLEPKSGEKILLAKDGCGVPTYCVSLYQIANAYVKLWCSEELAPVCKAILSKPYYLAGKDRIETDIILSRKYIAKSGSSGLFVVSCPQDDIAIALKISDGSDEAAESAAIEILRTVGLLDEIECAKFEKYRMLEINTSTHVFAGRFSPTWL